MGLFLWMPHLAPIMWNTTHSHWWRLVSLYKGVSCLGYHKLVNMWKLGGVVECPIGKASCTYAKLEIIMFHFGWCPTRTPNIVVGCTLIYLFLLHCRKTIHGIFHIGFHNIFIVHVEGHGKHTDVGCTMARLCGSKSCPNFSLHMACVKSMAFALHGKNQRFKGQVCNTWSPPHGDVHVHQPKWDHWWFSRDMEGREMVVESFDNLQPNVV